MTTPQIGKITTDTPVTASPDKIDLSHSTLPPAKPILIAQSFANEVRLNPLDVGVALFTLGAWGVSSAWNTSAPARDALGRAASTTLNKLQDLSGQGLQALDKILVPPVASGTVPPNAVPINMGSQQVPAQPGIAPLSPELRQQITQHLQAVNDCIKLSSQGHLLDINKVRDILNGTRKISEYLANNGHSQILSQQKANEIESFVEKRNGAIRQFQSDKARIVDFRNNIPKVINAIESWRNFSDEGKAALKDYLKQVNDYFNTAQIVSDRLEKTAGLGPYFNKQMRQEAMNAIDAKLTVQEWNAALEYYNNFRQKVSQGELPLTEKQLNYVLNYMEGLSNKLVAHGLPPEMTKATREQEARNYKGLILQNSWENKVKEYNQIIAEVKNGKFISDKDMNNLLNDLELISKQLVALGSQPLLTSEHRKKLATAYSQARHAFSPETGPVFPGTTPGGVGDPNYAANTPERPQDTTARDFDNRTTAPAPPVNNIADPNYAQKSPPVPPQGLENSTRNPKNQQSNPNISMDRTVFPNKPGEPSITTPKEREAAQQEEAKRQEAQANRVAEQREKTKRQEEQAGRVADILKDVNLQDPSTWGENTDVVIAMMNWDVNQLVQNKIVSATTNLGITIPKEPTRAFEKVGGVGRIGKNVQEGIQNRIRPGGVIFGSDLAGSTPYLVTNNFNKSSLENIGTIAMLTATTGPKTDDVRQSNGDGVGHLAVSENADKRLLACFQAQSILLEEIRKGFNPFPDSSNPKSQGIGGAQISIHQWRMLSSEFGGLFEIAAHQTLFGLPEFTADAPGMNYVETTGERLKEAMARAGYSIPIPASVEARQKIFDEVFGPPGPDAVTTPSGLKISLSAIPQVKLETVPLEGTVFTNVIASATNLAGSVSVNDISEWSKIANKNKTELANIMRKYGVIVSSPSEATAIKFSILNRTGVDLYNLKQEVREFAQARGIDIKVGDTSEEGKMTLMYYADPKTKEKILLQAWLGGPADFFAPAIEYKADADSKTQKAAGQLSPGLTPNDTDSAFRRVEGYSNLNTNWINLTRNIYSKNLYTILEGGSRYNNELLFDEVMEKVEQQNQSTDPKDASPTNRSGR